MPIWSALTNPPPSSVAGSRRSIRPVLAGKRKVTFTVAPAGTTFGVADPTSRKVPPRLPRPRTVSRAGAPVVDRDGPGPCVRRNGTGRRRERRRDRGRGREDWRGRGREGGNGGSDTPAGTYSAAAPIETHTPSSLQSLPPATRTVPSSSSVNEGLATHRACSRRSSRTRCAGRTAAAAQVGSPDRRPAISTVPSGSSAVGAVADSVGAATCGPGPGGRVVDFDDCVRTSTRHQHRAIRQQRRHAERALALHSAIAVQDPVTGS